MDKTKRNLLFDDLKIYLRALELDDYKTSIHWRTDNDIWDMVVESRFYVSEAYERKWVEEAVFGALDKLTLAVCLKENEELIGYVYLSAIDWKNKSAEFAKLIGKKECWEKVSQLRLLC